ncbi:MAG: hypothetical protein KF850_15505 [Labilithrix sp.]|nr:hypothetical protein [Labilithrix sp.]
MDRRKGARTIDEPLGKQSGKVPRHRDPPTPSEAESATSQLRRRFDLASEIEASRDRERAALAPREPGFVAEEPADGVPTPRPRMPLSCIPRRVMDERTLLTLPLDHRAGFVLAHVDGETSIRTLIDVCGLPHDELVALVTGLLALRAIELE